MKTFNKLISFAIISMTKMCIRDRGGNTQHPTGKPFHPHRLTRYTHGQRSNTIHPVPLRQVAHIMQKRMIVFHLSGMEQTAHILIPAVDATGTRLQAECIQITLSHHGILFIRHLFPTILRLFGEKIVTEIIPCCLLYPSSFFARFGNHQNYAEGGTGTIDG